MTVRVTTNWHRRTPLDAYEIPPDVRSQFDYVDWDACERGEDSVSFVRAYGNWYDLNDTEGNRYGDRMPESLRDWHAYLSETFFSGIVFRWVQDDGDWYVIVGRYFAGSDDDSEFCAVCGADITGKMGCPNTHSEGSDNDA